MNDHWNVLYQVSVFYADRKSKMATTAGHRLTLVSQSEHIIGPGSHVEYPTGTKNRNFVEDHPRNIPVWFQLAQWFRRRSLKCEKITEDGRQVMAIVHLFFMLIGNPRWPPLQDID
jgi:hypothetical protein